MLMPRVRVSVAVTAAVCCVTAAAAAAAAAAVDPLTQYQEYSHNTTTDHFGFTPLPKFGLRYFVNDTHWDREGGGPIFLYTGNEASISG